MRLETTVRLMIATLLVAALAGCDRQKAESPQPGAPTQAASKPQLIEPSGILDRSHAGTPAPAIRFEDPEGKPATFAEFRGKPLLVNLWATWCAPCIAEMPMLDALAAREQGIQVLALSQDTDGKEKVDAFFAERKFEQLEPYIDPQLAMMMALKLEMLPMTILYDANGKEVWRMTGKEDWTGARAARLLKEADAAATS